MTVIVAFVYGFFVFSYLMIRQILVDDAFLLYSYYVPGEPGKNCYASSPSEKENDYKFNWD